MIISKKRREWIVKEYEQMNYSQFRNTLILLAEDVDFELANRFSISVIGIIEESED